MEYCFYAGSFPTGKSFRTLNIIDYHLDILPSIVNGKSFRTLNIIDDFNREGLWITVDVSIASARVTRELNKLIEYRGKPARIRVDNGLEFTSIYFQD